MDGGGGSTVGDADRAVVEQIRGAALPRVRPLGAMPAGTAVCVIQDAGWGGPWKNVFTGVISAMAAPEPVISNMAVKGELAYWVDFDGPQFDIDGDGPYLKALIWDRYIERR